MSLNSQNRNSVCPVLSANNGGLVLEAVVIHRSASLPKRRSVSKRPTRPPFGGITVQPTSGHRHVEQFRHSTASTVGLRRDVRLMRATTGTYQQPAARDIPAALWAAVAMSSRAGN